MPHTFLLKQIGNSDYLYNNINMEHPYTISLNCCPTRLYMAYMPTLYTPTLGLAYTE